VGCRLRPAMRNTTRTICHRVALDTSRCVHAGGGRHPLRGATSGTGGRRAATAAARPVVCCIGHRAGRHLSRARMRGRACPGHLRQGHSASSGSHALPCGRRPIPLSPQSTGTGRDSYRQRPSAGTAVAATLAVAAADDAVPPGPGCSAGAPRDGRPLQRPVPGLLPARARVASPVWATGTASMSNGREMKPMPCSGQS
jgi:hypothetical protein